MIYESTYYNPNHLAHHGVKGMKWGVRRYQNPDGSLIKGAEKEILERRRQSDLKNTNTLTDKINKRVNETPEGKAYQELFQKRGKMLKTSDGSTINSLVYKNKNDMLKNRKNDLAITYAYNNKLDEYTKKYIDQYASALLKDVGYDDTSSAREYVKKYIYGLT